MELKNNTIIDICAFPPNRSGCDTCAFIHDSYIHWKSILIGVLISLDHITVLIIKLRIYG